MLPRPAVDGMRLDCVDDDDDESGRDCGRGWLLLMLLLLLDAVVAGGSSDCCAGGDGVGVSAPASGTGAAIKPSPPNETERAFETVDELPVREGGGGSSVGSPVDADAGETDEACCEKGSIPGIKPAASNCECKLRAFTRLVPAAPSPEEEVDVAPLFVLSALSPVACTGGGEIRSRGGVTCCRGSSKLGSITSKNTYIMMMTAKNN